MFAKYVSAIAPLALGLLLAAAAPALAQTSTTPPPQPEQGAGSAATGKTIPVAEYYEGGQTALYDFIALAVYRRESLKEARRHRQQLR